MYVAIGLLFARRKLREAANAPEDRDELLRWSRGRADYVDGTVLFASLLEAISLNPAIVIVPGHAFLAWETGRNTNEWKYHETTMVSTDSFDDACTQAELTAAAWKASAGPDPAMLTVWSMRELRAQNITPLE